jgi:hypothetical protein
MSDRRGPLEDTLTALGGSITFPPEPDLVPAVRARIRGDASLSRPRRRAWLRFAVAALALSVVASGVLIFSAGARRAVAGWLGVPGIHISTTPGRVPTSIGKVLGLGPQVTAGEATSRLGARLRFPSAPGLGAPAEIHADPANPVVWLVYRPTSMLPAVAGHGDVGLLVTEIRSGAIYGGFYKKLLGTGARVRNVSVDGAPGFWIHGQPHVIEYRFPLGIRQEKGRISGNSLIWTSGAITYRLELAGGIGTARTIAASLR